MESFEYSHLKKPKDIKMKVFFLGAYSDKGREGMMASSYDARVKAVSAMVERAGAKLGSVLLIAKNPTSHMVIVAN